MDEDNYDDFFVKVKIISIGEDFLKNFACNYPKYELCLVNEKITDEEIEKLVSDCEWLFVVADEKNLSVAKKIEKSAKCFLVTNLFSFPTAEEKKKIEESAKCFLVTNLFLFPTAEDIKISELEKDFGTVIALPEDKISELKFEKNELLTKIISSMILAIGDATLVGGRDFADIIDVMKNSGIIYASIGEGIAGSNPVDIVKKSLKNFLMKCDISKSTKTFISFVGAQKFNMIEIIEEIIGSANFIFDEIYTKNIREYEDDCSFMWQVAIDENIDGIRVLILTN